VAAPPGRAVIATVPHLRLIEDDEVDRVGGPGVPTTPARGPQRSTARVARAVALSAAVVVVLVVLFETWVTTVSEARSQAQLLEALKADLARTGEGAAAVRPEPGDAVGLLEIPRLGLEKVIVEGVSSRRLKSGPGHAPGTALPGQPGASVVAGRSTTYAGPFADLGRLQAGDEIRFTSSYGHARFVVLARGDAGATASATLDLVTAGGPLPSGGRTTVRAALDGQPLGGDELGTLPATPVAVRRHHLTAWFREPLGLARAAGWAALLVAVIVGASVGYRRWSAPATYLLTAPAIVALSFLVLGSLDRVLPVVR
jgi:sortase A